MATIIFDFDDTLFDNAKLKKDIQEVFRSFSITEKHILETYSTVRNAYNYNVHVNAVKNLYNEAPEEKILKALNDINLSQYLLPEVKNILQRLNKEHHLVLLTFGEKEFQEKKAFGSGIEKYFKDEHIHITQNHKVETIKKIKLKGEVYFVNDKENENDIIKKEFPDFNFILISPENPVSKINWQI